MTPRNAVQSSRMTHTLARLTLIAFGVIVVVAAAEKSEWRNESYYEDEKTDDRGERTGNVDGDGEALRHDKNPPPTNSPASGNNARCTARGLTNVDNDRVCTWPGCVGSGCTTPVSMETRFLQQPQNAPRGGFDVCPGIANDQQFDMDGDFIGDACDEDVDGDSLVNRALDDSDALTAAYIDPCPCYAGHAELTQTDFRCCCCCLPAGAVCDWTHYFTTNNIRCMKKSIEQN